jgi:putative nucleotidyltransferase with HDIG domain
LAVLATALVVVLPAVLVAAVVGDGGVLLTAISASSAVALSTALAGAGAALWKRRPQSRDVIFSDLMLWGWLRRSWTERRLSHTRELYEAARRSGATVDIDLLTSLSELLEARDSYTHRHGQRVARYAARVAAAMHVPAVDVVRIRTAAAIHDVGKLHTPRDILNNPGRLSNEEFAVIKRHPVDGADMLSAAGDPEIAAIVRHHHERLDGRGYPDGLAGTEIPLGARIVAVADTFDAITSSRAYRVAGTHKRALDVLAREAGSQLDPAAVAAFVRCYSSRRSVAWCTLATWMPQRILEALRTVPSVVGVTSGVGSIAPAIGAAGLLALSHGLASYRPQQSHVRASAAVAQHSIYTPTSGVTTVSSATRSRPTSTPGHPTRSRGHTRRSLSLGAGIRAAPASPGSSTAGVSQRAAGAGSDAPAPVSATPSPPANGEHSGPDESAPAESGVPPTTTEASTPVASSPGVATPVVVVPAITVPTVTTPGVTLPSVTVPGAEVAGTSVPSITVPSVTVPSVTVPSVTLPSVTLPSSTAR